jgi:hypothetical protein
MTTPRRPPTSGDVISSFAFAGMALWLADAAMQADGLRAGALWLTALACLAGALRHVIARIAGRRDR